MSYDSFDQFLEAHKRKILEECVTCGTCVEVCTNMEAFALGKGEAKALSRILVDALRGGELSEMVFKWVFGCNHCGKCVHACPKDIDPFFRNTILKAEFLRRGDQKVSTMRDSVRGIAGGGFKRIVNIMQDLQVRPSEVRWLGEIGGNPEPARVVLFLGCTGLSRPDLSLTLLDIMDMIGEDYVALGGTDFCCGMPFQMIGDVYESEKHVRGLAQGLSAFKPHLVLYACAECLYVMTHIGSHLVDVPFKQKSVLRFIADHLDRLGFSNPQPVRVTLHDSCGHGRLCGDYESPRRILKAIPGVELVEMKHARSEAPCCGGPGEMFFPGKGKALREMRIGEAEKTGARELVTLCAGCESSYLKCKGNKPFAVTNIIATLGRSLGIAREHRLGPFYLSKDVEGALEELKDVIGASGSKYTREDYRAVLTRILGA